MKTRYLLPNKFKKVGWLLFVPSLILGLILFFNDFEFPNWNVNVFSIFKEKLFKTNLLKNHNILIEISAIFIIIGGILVGFTKEKKEDEYIEKIRVESLIWATYVNYIVLFLAIILLFDFTFLNFMVINMFTLLLFFIIRFNFLLYKFKKSANNEK